MQTAFTMNKWLLKQLLLLLALVPAAFAQRSEITVTGKVTSGETRAEAVPGVTVLAKGTNTGTVTDQTGSYSLNIPANAVLVFSSIGFLTQEVAVNGQTTLHVTLAQDTKQLSEVVVVGYGAQNRKDLISSIATVNAEDIKNRPVASIDQQLQGRAAGVQVMANTGVPGDGIFFRIRGTTSINASNDPLYVVDGVFVNNQSLQKITTQGQANNPLADINPADIASISILKDAEATAIYGARAANGVVLITTKRGAYNTKPKASFNAATGWAWAPQLWDLVTGPEHATIINEAWVNDGKPFDTRPFRPVPEGGRGLPEEQPTYDRLGDIFRTGRLQNYDVSVSGGTAQTRYYIGGGYTKQEANLKTNDFQRASFKVNIDQQLSDRIRVGTSNTLSRATRSNARVGDGPQGGILQAALHTPTYLPKFNDDGTYAKWAGFDNLDVLIENTDMRSVSTRYIGNLYAEADLLKDLKFRTSWSLDFNDYDEYEYWNTLTNRGSANRGAAQSSVSKNLVWINEQTLSYRKAFGNHHTFGALVGNTLQGNTEAQTLATGTNFPNDSYQQIASASVTTASSSRSRYNLVSYFSRLDYNFANTYFAEISFRADASSRFGKDNKWAYFPSAGLGWRLKEEPFLREVSWLSDLKLRGSVGWTGNQNGIGDFASRGLWGAGNNYLDNPGTTPFQLSNPDLRWETTRQINGGLDVGLFGDRIGLEFNVYEKYTTDLLLQVPVPPSHGFSTLWQNEGEMSNRGFEFALNTVNLDRGGFRWQTSLNLARNINTIEKLPIPVDASYAVERMIEGYSMHSFYVYRQLHVDPETGDAVYEDYNGDGALTAADRQVVGNALPKLFGGINNTFSYKGFDASIFFNFQYGNQVFNNNRFFHESGGTRDDRRAINKNQLSRWQQPGDVTEVPRVTTLGTNYSLNPISRFVEDGSFLRLNTLNIGYSVPQRLTHWLRASAIRVYFSGSNLRLWKRYQGPDPEINVTANPTTLGYDLGTPPQPRTVQFGLNVTL